MQRTFKPTMFQMMVDCESIDDVFKWREGLTHRITFYANLKGHLETSLEIEKLKANGISSGVIGSVCFKFCHLDKTISILIFTTGKIKISGGYPLAIIAHNSAAPAVLDSYLDELVTKVQNITKLACGTKKISCLNGQLCIPPFKTTSALDAFIKRHRHKFGVYKQPRFDAPGRRGAYKLYLNTQSKTHIAVDVKGKGQIFAAKTFDELFLMFHILD